MSFPKAINDLIIAAYNYALEVDFTLADSEIEFTMLVQKRYLEYLKDNFPQEYKGDAEMVNSLLRLDRTILSLGLNNAKTAEEKIELAESQKLINAEIANINSDKIDKIGSYLETMNAYLDKHIENGKKELEDKSAETNATEIRFKALMSEYQREKLTDFLIGHDYTEQPKALVDFLIGKKIKGTITINESMIPNMAYLLYYLQYRKVISMSGSRGYLAHFEMSICPFATIRANGQLNNEIRKFKRSKGDKAATAKTIEAFVDSLIKK